MGVGIVGVRRLMDRFHIESSAGGTTVELGKPLPRRSAVTTHDLARVGEGLARGRPQDPCDEVRQQNQELLRTLEELRAR